jgi:hypothetical protein
MDAAHTKQPPVTIFSQQEELKKGESDIVISNDDRVIDATNQHLSPSYIKLHSFVINKYKLRPAVKINNAKIHFNYHIIAYKI